MSPTRGVRLPLSHTLGHPLSLLQPERGSGAGPRHSGSHFVFGTGSGRDKTLPEHEHWGPRRPGGTRGTQERVCSLSTSTCSTSAGASGPPPSSCQIAALASVTQQDMCPAKLTHTLLRGWVGSGCPGDPMGTVVLGEPEKGPGRVALEATWAGRARGQKHYRLLPQQPLALPPSPLS